MLDTSCALMTAFGETWQNAANFSLTSCVSGVSALQTSTSGLIPRPLNSFTVCCVGLVFCSPTGPITGTSET